MQEGKPILVYCTVGTAEDAKRLAQAILQERLAACVNVVPTIRSFYWWEGEMQDEEEVLLLVKTRADLYSTLEEFIVSHHPYSVPAISAIPLEEMHAPYLAWLLEETQR